MTPKQVTQILALGGLLLLPHLTSAQPVQTSSVELIVRTETTQSGLQKQLQTGATAKTTEDSLFAGVDAVTPIFETGDQQKRTGGTSAIPAFRLRVQDSTTFRRLRARWQRHPDVRYAHANVEFRVQGRRPNDDPVLRTDNVLADSLNHLEVTRSRAAWDVTTGSADVRIGVIDTGFFLDHPDLAGQFWINEAEDINGNGQFDPYPAEQGGDLNGIDDDGNGYVDDVVGYDFVDRSAPIEAGEFQDRDPIPAADPERFFSWHGTAVAGVATAAPRDPREGIAGVAPGARLVALRAFGGDGRGRSDDIAAAIVYGASMNLDVLNLSFGQDRSVPLIRDAVEYASDQGTVVVASAGNELTDDPHYPSDYPDVLSVVWLGEDGELPQFNQSQFGIGVDLGAPGSDVFTADFPDEDDPTEAERPREELYRSANGSSFSAPQVAGAAALLRSLDSSLSPASVRSILTGTATDIEGANWDHQTGAGLLNVRQALSRAYPARTEIDVPAHNAGVQGQDPVPVTGTAIDPDFDHYALYYAEGTTDLDQRTEPWVQIQEPSSGQVLRDTLGVWDPTELEEGAYTLRLVTTLRDGRTIEDRRRVWVDDSPPVVEVNHLGVGRTDGENGVIADVTTDDVTRLRMQVDVGPRTETMLSEQEARRHGLSWPDERGTGGEATIRLAATNPSGLTTTIDTSLRVPESQENTGLVRRTVTSLPRGRLLPSLVDFDDDGLSEVLMNQFQDGGVTDTLRTFEWDGSGLVPNDTLVVGPFFPKDVGDTNGDGLQELLLQVSTATLLVEQPESGAFPTDLIFADTSRISDAPADTLNGTRLTDLDADGRGEILGSFGRQWRVLERKSSGFQEIARLNNPTEIGPDSSQGNVFDFQEAATGDFDGDGRRDLLVGDRDGDLIVYEAAGDDQIEVAWTAETDRVNAGTRFATGDFSGTGRTDFVTMTTTPHGELPDGTVAPPISYYSVWKRAGDDAYERAFRLPIEGIFSRDGALGSGDVDGDGRAEVVVVHPPSLMILDRAPDGRWRVRHEDRPSEVLSRSLLVADVSGTGSPSILAGTNDGGLVRYAVDPGGLAVSPPRWVEARPGGATTARLRWQAPSVDSVTVFAGPPDADLDPVATTTDSAVTLSGTETRRFALRAWADGDASPLSPERSVRPHAPATVSGVSYPEPPTVQLTFTEPLAPTTRAKQFQLGAENTPPERLVQAQNGRGVVLHFPSSVTGRQIPLQWTEVVDETGLAVGQTDTLVAFPATDQRSLFIKEAQILSPNRLRLAFNEPLRPSAARQPSRYAVRPRGRVTEVQVDPSSADTVDLRVEGLVLGASGQEASLAVSGLVSANGSRLSEEGATVRLTKPADDLSNVFVYPNPYRMSKHTKPLTIAGLPGTATIRIYTPAGRLVRTLSVEGGRDGGREWNLQNERGETVSSGVYLLRVNAPDESPVLEKAAIIR